MKFCFQLLPKPVSILDQQSIRFLLAQQFLHQLAYGSVDYVRRSRGACFYQLVFFSALCITDYSPFGLNMSIALPAKSSEIVLSFFFCYKLKRTQARVQFPYFFEYVEQVCSRPERMLIELYSISFLCNFGASFQ